MPSRPTPARPHVALLRGINVGGKNMLPMKDLAAMFVRAGCEHVQTYIQSGNVIFATTPALAKDLPAKIEAAIKKRFGFIAPVVLRDADDLRKIVADNPFVAAGAEPSTLHVAFLAHAPPAKAIASLDPQRSPGDECEVRGSEIYLRLPNGVARTKLTNAYFDAKLATTSTVRNWRTVQKLLAMTDG